MTTANLDPNVRDVARPEATPFGGIDAETASGAGQSAEFSLVLGGPLYQLWCRSRLSDDLLRLVRRRMAVMAMLAWVPLLVLTVAEGTAWGGSVRLPFLLDFEMHLRLLVALPLLIGAELFVHRRMRPVMQLFLAGNLIPPAARAQFDAAVASAMRLRNSVTVEVVLIAIVVLAGGLVWRSNLAVDGSTWFAQSANGTPQPSLAGWWLGWVSLPIFQFLLLRWYFRLFNWGRLLWRISRIDLNFMPTHPDRCGGVSFLAGTGEAFAPFLLAQGVVLAGMMANRIFHSGANLPDFKLELVGLVILMVLAVLGPLLFFSPKLAAAKRAGSREYGILAQRYASEFDRKWLRGGAPPDEPLIGSADIQSLADIGTSFSVVKEMRWVPFTFRTVLQLGVTTLAPIAPLLLTVVPLEELLTRLFALVF